MNKLEKPTRLRFSYTDDIILLREFIRENPYNNPAAWENIWKNFQILSGRQFTQRSVKQHLMLLVETFIKKQKLEKVRSGVETVTEKDVLLQEASDIIEEFSVLPRKKIDKTKRAMDLGKVARDKYIQNMINENTEEVVSNCNDFNTEEVVFTCPDVICEVSIDHDYFEKTAFIDSQNNHIQPEANEASKLSKPNESGRNFLVPWGNRNIDNLQINNKEALKKATYSTPSTSKSQMKEPTASTLTKDNTNNDSVTPKKTSRNVISTASTLTKDNTNNDSVTPKKTSRNVIIPSRARNRREPNKKNCLGYLADKQERDHKIRSRELDLEERRLSLEERKVALEEKKAEIEEQRLKTEWEERKQKLELEKQHSNSQQKIIDCLLEKHFV